MGMTNGSEVQAIVHLILGLIHALNHATAGVGC
jgi:hypothetical protein